MSAVVTIPSAISERTGGRTRTGYEDLLEGLMTDVQGTPLVHRVLSRRFIPSGLPPPVTVHALAQALLKVIEVVFLPEDPQRFEFYEALAESLRQRMVDYQQSTATSGMAVEISHEGEEERYYAGYYERHESPEILQAFLRILRSMPVEREERTPVYTDEELEAFS
jgi:hypothetical protein